MTRRLLFSPLAWGVAVASLVASDQTVPICPVCHTPSADPNLPSVFGDEDGVFRGATLVGERTIICNKSGCHVHFSVTPPTKK